MGVMQCLLNRVSSRQPRGTSDIVNGSYRVGEHGALRQGSGADIPLRGSVGPHHYKPRAREHEMTTIPANLLSSSFLMYPLAAIARRRDGVRIFYRAASDAMMPCFTETISKSMGWNSQRRYASLPAWKTTEHSRPSRS